MKQHIVICEQQTIQSEIDLRPGESKLGQHVCFLKPGETLLDLTAYAQKGIGFALLDFCNSTPTIVSSRMPARVLMSG